MRLKDKLTRRHKQQKRSKSLKQNQLKLLKRAKARYLLLLFQRMLSQRRAVLLPPKERRKSKITTMEDIKRSREVLWFISQKHSQQHRPKV